MRGIKKIRRGTIISLIIMNIFLCFNFTISNAEMGSDKNVRASVLLRDPSDPYNALLKNSLEKIQSENQEKIEFTFYDSKNNQSVQNQLFNQIIQSGNVDIVLINIIDARATKNIIDKVKERNIPIGFFNIEEPNMDAVRSYSKAYFVGTNPAEAGVLQGKILVNVWNNNKKIVDRNRDNIMQYVMLIGNKNNLEAIGRTRYSVSTINDAGIRTEELASRVCNWEESVARDAMEQVFLQNGNKIEVIISNNDAMAIGAIDVLQKYGYNKGDVSKTIPVVGVDAIPEAQELIQKGYMTGTVVQDAYSMTKAVYEIGMNLVFNRPPLYGTEYKFDETEVSVRIPYKEYIENES